MGIDYQVAWFLTRCASNSKLLTPVKKMDNNFSLGKVDFSNTITLGRQEITVSKNQYKKLFNRQDDSYFTKQRVRDFFSKLDKATAQRYPNAKYAEPFFELIERRTTIVDSLDFSSYEEATVIHDLVVPIPNNLKEKYTCVFDGGLLEHVFNYPIALQNAMDMVAIGGHLISVTPGNNWFGHGFYQFSPELFYSVLQKENGFEDTQVYLCNSNKWYLINNTKDRHYNMEISPKWNNALLFVVSKKISNVPSNIVVYQNHYEEIWSSKKHETIKKENETVLRKVYHTWVPLFIRSYIRKIKLYYKRDSFIARYKKRKTVFIPVKL